MFIGRKDYLDDLESLWRKRTSSIVACRGRRRIGKSTLFREFAKRAADVYMEFEGLAPNPKHPVTNEDQLAEFAATLARLTASPVLSLPNWKDAFFWLDRAIDDSKKTVVLLDEISWMGGCDPNFPAVLRNAWETWFHRHERLIVVVCGSVSAWIKRNILGNTGFAGRFSRDARRWSRGARTGSPPFRPFRTGTP
ncbi:MAG: AAA family ATPase [Kiritimatiellae bacterium]|nr:AAA family ATPase [Kiritimatiellia bacterium]